MSDRNHRRALIRRVLVECEVGSQEQLAELLRERGVGCTQATLSRDLRDMGVTRVAGTSGPRYQLDPRAAYRQALRKVVGMEILDVRHNGSLVVVRTLAGRAAGVAGYLAKGGIPDILGTVAGDDTLFVAPTQSTRAAALAAAIAALMEGEEDTP
jgi:transcriptional regulator of arginine metabolism